MFMHYEPHYDVEKLENIFCEKLMPLGSNERNHRNASKKCCFIVCRKMFSLFSNSRNSKGKQRAIKSPAFFKFNSVKPRTNVHIRRQSFDDDDLECFHRSIGPILLLAQFFGILPIAFIRSCSLRKLSFRKWSPRAIYAYIVLVGLFVMTAISVIHLLKTLNANSFQTKGGISYATAGAVFYGNSLLGNLLFLRLCPRWISIQFEWRSMERLLNNSLQNWKVPQLRWRFLIISVIILTLAFLEHVMSMVNNTPPQLWNGNRTLEDYLQDYTNKSHRFIISNIEYNFTLGLFIFIISKVATFTWNFTDLFIMLVSTAIAERYKYLNERVTGASPVQLTVMDWHELRESYALLSALVKKIDNEISGIILLSFVNNIYFICLQLLNGLSPSSSTNSIINSIYFFGSFIFLIGRTTAVTLLTARINDQCKHILPVLYTCPSINYCLEAQRLQQQISTDDVALTGHRFFSITRNFMLAVAGAIVTYEVVLLQFNIALQRDDGRSASDAKN